MHHPTDMIAHTTAFVTSIVEHWLEREIAQWVTSLKLHLTRKHVFQNNESTVINYKDKYFMKSTSFILSIGLVLYFGDGGDENFGGFLKIVLVLCGGELMWCFYLYIH